jgi:hypothetical protein
VTLNTSQVSYYMTQRKKGATQHISAMKAGISVRSGRRIEKDQWSKAGERHWRTRKDPRSCVGQRACPFTERKACSDANHVAGNATG